MSEFSLKVFHVELPNARSKKISITTHHHPVGVPFQSCHFRASRDFTASKKTSIHCKSKAVKQSAHMRTKQTTATATYSFTFHPWDLWQCCLFCLLPPVCQIVGRKEPLQWSPEFLDAPSCSSQGLNGQCQILHWRSEKGNVFARYFQVP